MTNHAKDFKKIIEVFRYQHNIRQLFVDWLEIAACSIHQEPYHLGLVARNEDFEKIEAQYLAAVKKYNRDELDSFAKLLAITKLALWQEKSDFLGKLYMELEISNDRNGEFFTPYQLSLTTARMILGDITTQIQEKGFITVADPASGAGGLLIAAAQAIQEQNHNPSEVIFFDATDISRTCFNMTYLQTAILGLSGYVRHANSLSLEQWEGRFTPICRAYPHRTQRFLNSLKTLTDNQSTQTPNQPTGRCHANPEASPWAPTDHHRDCSFPLQPAPSLPKEGIGAGAPLHQTTLFDLAQYAMPAPSTHPKSALQKQTRSRL